MHLSKTRAANPKIKDVKILAKMAKATYVGVKKK